MQSPKTDNFRLEQRAGSVVLTFTPDGRTYTFLIDGDQVAEPTISPAWTSANDYADDEVRTMAAELARRALRGVSSLN